MKKLVSIIILVIVMAMNISAMADAVDGIMYGINYWEAYEIMEEFADVKGYDDWYISNDVGETLYGMGIISKEEFENDFGESWSIEAFNKRVIRDFDVCDIKTTVIDEVDGIKFYRVRAHSETTPVGYKDNKPFYYGDMIFFVFSSEMINEK